MIVITTPTGTIGSQVLKSLITKNAQVRVIVRDSSKLDAEVRDRIEVVIGSQNDPDVVTKAFQGADAIFWITPPKPDADDVTGYYLTATRIAADAIRKNGVKRVVWVSTLGHETGKEAGQLTAALVADKPLVESGAAYRILRPATFMENMLRQVGLVKERSMFFLAGNGDRVLPSVATGDIARVAVELLLDDSWNGGGSINLVGPDNLTPNEMAEVLSKTLGKPIAFRQAKFEDYQNNLMRFGISEAWAKGAVDMAKAIDEGFYDEDAAATRRSSTSFEAWCEQVLKPALDKEI